MAERQIPEQAVWKSSDVGSLLKALTDKQGLRGMFQNDRVPRHQRGDNRVDGGKIRVVPRCHRQHDAHRLAHDVAFKPRLSLGRNGC